MSHPAPHVPAAPDVQLADDSQRPVRRALLSVYDKTGLVELATAASSWSCAARQAASAST